MSSSWATDRSLLPQKSAYLIDGKAIDMSHPRGNLRWRGVRRAFKAVACNNEAASHSYIGLDADAEKIHFFRFKILNESLNCWLALVKINNALLFLG